MVWSSSFTGEATNPHESARICANEEWFTTEARRHGGAPNSSTCFTSSSEFLFCVGSALADAFRVCSSLETAGGIAPRTPRRQERQEEISNKFFLASWRSSLQFIRV